MTNKYIVSLETCRGQRTCNILGATAETDILKIIDMIKESAERRGHEVISIHACDTWEEVTAVLNPPRRNRHRASQFVYNTYIF